MSEDKKKFKDTAVGKFLSDKAPHLLNVVGDILPDKGVLGIVKNLISSEPTISIADKEAGIKLIQEHEAEMMRLENEANQVAQTALTERLRIDMLGDSWLSKNIRPMTLIYLCIIVTALCVLDSAKVISVDDMWKDVFKYAWMAVLSFYFIGKEIQKGMKIQKK